MRTITEMKLKFKSPNIRNVYNPQGYITKPLNLTTSLVYFAE